MLAIFFIALILSGGNIANFIVIVLSFDLMYIVYRKGLIRKLLDRLKLDSNYPDIEELEQMEELPQISYQDKIKSDLEERQELERKAKDILTVQGQTNPETVSYMADIMLIHIIREYYDSITCDKTRQQLENICSNILTYNGFKKDTYSFVKGLNDYEIAEIITRFKADTVCNI